MIKAVVFDLDGTLLNTIPDIAGALNRALAACGLPTHSVEACKTFIGGGIREAVRKYRITELYLTQKYKRKQVGYAR